MEDDGNGSMGPIAIWASWSVLFLILKFGGASIATWSVWWVLLPVVPVGVVIFRYLAGL